MEKMGYEFFVPLLGHKLPYELIVRDEYIYICFDYQIEKMKAR